MSRPYQLTRCLTTVAAMAVYFFVLPARAASLTGPIAGWASGVPSYVSMYEYVPANVAVNPPILVVSHYCGGTAAGVFGEAQGGGIVAAADKYGFVMIFPQTSNNCWDVGSTKSLTHDGGGDTQAIAEMVTYSIAKHKADANRVYATGTSSGAMMTEALLAVYPDVFKAGAEFSGVAAGCWAASYSASNQWSGPCADGQVSHTAAQWGDTVRAMYPAYAGNRPRIQLWHGLADSTINFNNQGEAIKEWTNVLGLSATAASTTTLSIGSHQWTRQSWQNECGFTVLEAWAEQNGPHGTDANLNATYVIPFLGLDKTAAVDPEVAQCSAGGGGGGAGMGSGGTTTAAGSAGASGGSGVSGQGGTGAFSGATAGGNGGAANGGAANGGTSVSSAGQAGFTAGGGSAAAGTDGGAVTVGNGGSAGLMSATAGSSPVELGGSGGARSDESGCSFHVGKRGGSRAPLEWLGLAALGAVLIRYSTRRAARINK